MNLDINSATRIDHDRDHLGVDRYVEQCVALPDKQAIAFAILPW